GAGPLSQPPGHLAGSAAATLPAAAALPAGPEPRRRHRPAHLGAVVLAQPAGLLAQGPHRPRLPPRLSDAVGTARKPTPPARQASAPRPRHRRIIVVALTSSRRAEGASPTRPTNRLPGGTVVEEAAAKAATMEAVRCRLRPGGPEPQGEPR